MYAAFNMNLSLNFFRSVVPCGVFASAFFLISNPRHAACSYPAIGANPCAQFDPTSVTNVQNAGRFTGTPAFDPPDMVSQAYVRFAINGSWISPVTITGISISGDGLNAPKAISGSVTLTTNNTWVYSNVVSLDSSLSSINWANSTVSFTIPQDAANIPIGGNPVNWSSISARISYESPDMAVSATSSRLQFTARNPAPAPLPLAGIVPAFVFSRQLRKRISFSCQRT